MTSLTAVPDITSVVLSWTPPQEGAGHLTRYEVRHSQDSILLGASPVSGETTSYRVQRLEPGMEYVFEVRAFVGFLEGPSEQVTGTTAVVGKAVFLCSGTVT